MLSFESAKGRFPGYAQLVKRSTTQAVGVRHSTDGHYWTVVSVDSQRAVPVSWAAMLLPKIDRQDVWDALLNPKADADLPPAEREGVLLVRLIDLFVCPSDGEAHAVSGTPALSYSVNAGAPDWNNGTFLAGPNAGDTTNNGVFLNQYEFAARRIKAPISRLVQRHRRRCHDHHALGKLPQIVRAGECGRSGAVYLAVWHRATSGHRVGCEQSTAAWQFHRRSRAYQCRQRRRL